MQITWSLRKGSNKIKQAFWKCKKVDVMNSILIINKSFYLEISFDFQIYSIRYGKGIADFIDQLLAPRATRKDFT